MLQNIFINLFVAQWPSPQENILFAPNPERALTLCLLNQISAAQRLFACAERITKAPSCATDKESGVSLSVSI
jgi:hypothetical protein